MDALHDLPKMIFSTMALLLSLSMNLITTYIIWRLCRTFVDYLFPGHRQPASTQKTTASMKLGNSKPNTADADAKAPARGNSDADALWFTALFLAMGIAGFGYVIGVFDTVQKGGMLLTACAETTVTVWGVVIGLAASVAVTALVVKGLVMLG